ncbi:MAG: hypothetical protein ACK4TA_15220 [Saprospiraceae bacterium]
MEIKPNFFTYIINNSDTIRVSSLSSYAYLVASKTTSLRNISFFINKLNKVGAIERQIVKKEDILPFKAIFDENYHSIRFSSFRSLLIFITAVVVATIPVFLFLIWAISGINYWKYLREIHQNIVLGAIPNNVLPVKTKKNKFNLRLRKFDSDERIQFKERIHFNMDPGNLKKPLIRKDQLFIINSILSGLSYIVETRENLSRDLSIGKFIEQHYNFLNERLDAHMQKLRKSLAIRLSEVIENKYEFWKNLGNEKTHLEYLRLYFTADYLVKEDYEWLCSLVKNTDKKRNKSFNYPPFRSL